MAEIKRPLKVFLSYASQDKPAVRELSRRLASEGWIDPWVDEKKLLPGQDWRLKIEEAVETSDIVVICLSTNSVTKEGFVQKELRYAREIAFEKPEETIFLIPLRLDDCIVPRGLRFYQWGDYFDEMIEETYASLLEALKLRYEQKLKIEEELARREKERHEREAAEKATREKAEREAAEKAAREKAEREAAEKAAREQAKREAAEKAEREKAEKAARERAEREATEKAKREKAEKEAAEKATREREKREAAEKAEREKAERIAREKLEREVIEKAKREKAEREAGEKVAREKAKLIATEKARRERKERLAALIAEITKTFNRSFHALKSNLVKSKPYLRITGGVGVIALLFWIGSIATPKLNSLIPTMIKATMTLTTSTIAPVTTTATPSHIPSNTFTSIASPSSAPSPTVDASCISGNRPLQVAWSSDGAMMAISSLAGVYIFDAKNYSLLKFLPVNNGTGGIAFDPTSDSLYATTNDKVLKMWLNNGEVTQTFDEEANIVDTVIVSQDGKKLLVSTDKGLITIWDVASGEVWRENKDALFPEYSVFTDIRHVITSPNFDWVGFILNSHNREKGRFEGSLTLWEPNSDTTRVLDTFTNSGTNWVATTGSGELIAYNDEPGIRVSIIRVTNLSIIRTIVGNSPFSFSSDGTKFAYVRWIGTGWEIWFANPEGENIALFAPSTTPSTPTPEEATQEGYGFSGIGGPRPYLNSDGSQLILIWRDTLEVFDTTDSDSPSSQVLFNHVDDQLCIQN